MNTDKTGGAAFPSEYEMFSSGMTLRDYFAGQALPGLMPHYIGTGEKYDRLAAEAYKIAHAMLEEREK